MYTKPKLLIHSNCLMVLLNLCHTLNENCGNFQMPFQYNLQKHAFFLVVCYAIYVIHAIFWVVCYAIYVINAIFWVVCYAIYVIHLIFWVACYAIYVIHWIESVGFVKCLPNRIFRNMQFFELYEVKIRVSMIYFYLPMIYFWKAFNICVFLPWWTHDRSSPIKNLRFRNMTV